MIIYNGKKGKTAKVMIDNIDETTAAQIQSIISNPNMDESPVIMPDCHAGKGCVVGYTCKLENNLIPNLIGVDIGCGMALVKFAKVKLDFERFDRHVKQNIPMGFNINTSKAWKGKLCQEIEEVSKSIHAEHLYDRFIYSLGTLGGGNHFVEVDEDEDYLYAVVHSGSRNFGKMIAEFYQKRAVEYCGGASRPKNCEGKGFKLGVPEDQAHISMEAGGEAYLRDMKVAQEYALVNRIIMVNQIENYFRDVHGLQPLESYQCIHNYISFDDKIIRKGAISAHKDEKVIIPLNMRDGIILGVGKGNAEWNYSAPHGAGRVLSRSQAKKKVNLDDFKETMKGIYSSTVSQDTIDESPFAYKDAQSIIDAIGDTVEITKIIKPIYNVKAGGD